MRYPAAPRGRSRTATLDQAPGVDALAPVDAALGLAEEKYSHEVRRIVAEESARASFDDVVELVKKHMGAEVPCGRASSTPHRG